MFNFNDHLQELRSTIIGLVLLSAATIIGFVWISIGVYHWLSTCLGSVWGPIVLGLIYFLPIVIFAFTKAFTRSPAPALSAQNEHADIAAVNVTKIIENLSGRSPFVVASAAILAGFLATRFPALLSVFMQILTVYAEDVKNRATKASHEQSEQAENNSKEL
jgi:amino acid transporter